MPPDAAIPRAALEAVLRAYGLRVLGGWIPGQEDALPSLPGACAAAVVWMVGQVGSECWSAFSGSTFFGDGLPDPMDRWAKGIGNGLATELGGVSLYPSDGPPYHPFQRWAARSGRMQASPLMLQIDPDHGLWHAYRFALALPGVTEPDARDLARTAAAPAADLCLHCSGQPCLNACPVDAFDGQAYDVDRCAGHLHGPRGATCMPTGCRARQACPVGTEYRYQPDHAAFHMAAFAAHHPVQRRKGG